MKKNKRHHHWAPSQMSNKSFLSVLLDYDEARILTKDLKNSLNLRWN